MVIIVGAFIKMSHHVILSFLIYGQSRLTIWPFNFPIFSFFTPYCHFAEHFSATLWRLPWRSPNSSFSFFFSFLFFLLMLFPLTFTFSAADHPPIPPSLIASSLAIHWNPLPAFSSPADRWRFPIGIHLRILPLCITQLEFSPGPQATNSTSRRTVLTCYGSIFRHFRRWNSIYILQISLSRPMDCCFLIFLTLTIL